MTKPDTKTEIELTTQQEQALDGLITGLSVTQAAEKIGVARQTVSGWLNHDTAFIATYNQRRQLLAEEMDNRVRALVSKAVGVLDDELSGDNRLDAAKMVLRTVLQMKQPAGPTTVAEVEADQQFKVLCTAAKTLQPVSSERVKKRA